MIWISLVNKTIPSLPPLQGSFAPFQILCMCGESTLQLRNVVPIASLLPPTIFVYIVAISVTMLKKDKDLKTLIFRGRDPGHRITISEHPVAIKEV